MIYQFYVLLILNYLAREKIPFLPLVTIKFLRLLIIYEDFSI